MKTIIVLATWLVMAASGTATATQEQIGSWVLDCASAVPGNSPAAAANTPDAAAITHGVAGNTLSTGRNMSHAAGNASGARSTMPNTLRSTSRAAVSPRPSAAICLLRLEKRLFDKAGVTGDLEVLADGASLVPVLTVRGLSSEMLMAAALAGKPEASIRLNNSPLEVLDCKPSDVGYVCSAHNEAARTLAAGLPTARLATVRVSISVTGLKSLPIQEKAVELAGTSEALARLRTAGPAQLPAPATALLSASPARLLNMADEALKAAGYPNGVADLQALLAKYRNK